MAKNALNAVSDEAIEAVALRFRALGEVSRLYILRALQNGESAVTELVHITGLSQPNVSRHLSVLVTSGLVARRKEGLNVLYRVADEHLQEICSVVCKSVSAAAKRRQRI